MSRSFPYAFTPEPNLPRWQLFRAEGKPLRESMRNGHRYVRKALQKKFTAPPEEVAHFDGQRDLFRKMLLAPKPQPDATLALLGDIMWIRDGWDAFLDPPLLDYLNSHDAVVGNLETILSTRFRLKTFWPDYATYNSDPKLITTFRRPDGRSTFTAFGFANNHTFDRGDDGVADTLALLDQEGILQTGIRSTTLQRPYVTFTLNGIKVGYYATCWGLNEPELETKSVYRLTILRGLAPEIVAPVDVSPVRKVLDDMAAEGVEFRIVAPHWGYEYEYYPDPGVMVVARDLVAAGADAIVGSHPHVQQPCEVAFVNGYPSDHAAADTCRIDADGPPRKALIAYSIGNFSSTMFTFACKIGWILSLSLHRRDGRVDWEPWASRFVVNDPKCPPEGVRKLLLADDYVRRCREGRGLSMPRQRTLEFLQRHLFGLA